MYIDVNEAAKLLKVNTATLCRWVQKGLLSSYRVDEGVSFDREELIRFIKKTNFSKIEVDQMEDDATDLDIDERLILTRALNRGIFTKLTDHLERDALFNKVVDLLGYVNEINFPRELLVAKLIEREEEISTVMTKGVALPHPKNTPELHFDKSVICVVTLQKPIILNKCCTEPIDLFFFLFSKNPMEHLKLLSTIAKIVNQTTDIKEQINNLESRKEVVELFKTSERKLLGV